MSNKAECLISTYTFWFFVWPWVDGVQPFTKVPPGVGFLFVGSVELGMKPPSSRSMKLGRWPSWVRDTNMMLSNVTTIDLIFFQWITTAQLYVMCLLLSFLVVVGDHLYVDFITGLNNVTDMQERTKYQKKNQGIWIRWKPFWGQLIPHLALT